MRRIAPAIALSAFLAVACSSERPGEDVPPEQAAARYIEAREALRGELQGIASELRPFVVARAPAVALSPLLDEIERERVIERAGHWHVALKALPRGSLSEAHAAELDALIAALGQIVAKGSSPEGGARQVSRMAALELGLAGVEARYDALDVQAATADWRRRALGLAERMARHGAGNSGRSQLDAEFMGCVMAQALENGEPMASAAAKASDGALEGLVSLLRPRGAFDEHCVERSPPEALESDATIRRDVQADTARRKRSERLLEQFAPNFQSLDLPPASLVPLDRVVATDPIFAGDASQGAYELISDAASRPDRWLEPMLAAVLGESVEVKIEPNWGGLNVVKADALYVAPSPGRRNEALLIVDRLRLAQRRDWEAAAVVVDALVADCFRQPLLQVQCAASRVNRAAEYFQDGRYPGDSRLGIGVLLRIRGHVLGPGGLAESGDRQEDGAVSIKHGLGRIATVSDLDALASALSVESEGSL